MISQDSFTYRETFFRPEAYRQEEWTMPAILYNRTHLLLTHTKNKCVFVPIRAMQYLAIIDKEEIVFIDGVGSYMQKNGQGGRIIELAWRDFHPQARASLLEPVPCRVVYYFKSAELTMKRVIQAFSEALTSLEQRQPSIQAPVQILSIHP